MSPPVAAVPGCARSYGVTKRSRSWILDEVLPYVNKRSEFPIFRAFWKRFRNRSNWSLNMTPDLGCLILFHSSEFGDHSSRPPHFPKWCIVNERECLDILFTYKILTAAAIIPCISDEMSFSKGCCFREYVFALFVVLKIPADRRAVSNTMTAEIS